MADRRASFGTLTTGRVFFNIRLDARGGQVPAWTTATTIHTHVYPGAFPPRSDVEVVSIGPSRVTWRIHLDTREDYWQLLAKLGTTDTLTVIAGLQGHRGVYEEIHGVGYESLAQTLLASLDDEAFFTNGTVEVSATFQRHIDPETGLVVPI